MKKILAILLAMVMVLAVSLPAFATDGSYPDPVDIRAIPGIDYNRITEKATKGKQSHPVELKMGDHSFIGALSGSHGLTFEEINAIIKEVLDEMDLTADRIALVSKLAGQAEEDARMYFWDQVLEGLMSFIPAPPGIDIGDYYAYIVHGEQKNLNHEQNFAIGMTILLAEQAINEDIADGYGAIGKFFQKYDKVLFGKGTANVPLSYIVNTVTVSKEWLEGSKRFEKYLDDLSAARSEVTLFYAKCSQKANDLAEQKKGENAWHITFDKDQNLRTYNATFWGIEGIPIQAELSGELVKVDDDDEINGAYEGVLYLELKGLELKEHLDRDFCLRTTEHPTMFAMRLSKVETLAYLGAEVRDRATKTAILESSLTGMFTVEIETDGKNAIYGEMDGAFDTPGNTKFVFEHDVSIFEGLSLAPTDEKLDGSLFSDDINGLTATGRLFNDYVSHTDLPMSTGTLWDPIESEPILTIQ